MLLLWVPPQFDPNAETSAGELFQMRLDEFAARRPGLQVEVRVKSEATIIDTLTVTNAAAPSLVPDLVALSRPNLETAVLKGLLHPLDGLTTQLDDPDWYPYAVQMAHIQNTAFGIPFAGNAQVLAGYGSPLPENWLDVKEQTFIFLAADPQALFSLSLYISSGGTLTDEQGRLALNEAILTNILTFYADARENGTLLRSVNDYQTSEQTWQAFQEKRTNLAVTWTYFPLNNPASNMTIAPLPGLSTATVPLATGYAWALSGADSDKQALAVELAEFLSDSAFLAEWTEATGMLPTRPTALSSWKDAEIYPVLAEIAQSAQLIPTQDALIVIGPLIQGAVKAVLTEESAPRDAAHAVTEQLK